MTLRSLPLLAVALGILSAPAAEAAPKAARPHAVGSVFKGKPTPERGKAGASVTNLPSEAERASAATSLSNKLPAQKMAWASVSVRRPHVLDHAALVFMLADAVDAKRGIASWGLGATGIDLGSLLDGLCEEFGCPGGESASTSPAPAKGMQIWVKAASGKDYMVVCRVRLDTKVGDVVVASDGGFTMTNHIDHTGKPSGRISFLVDATSAGWYGFTISSANRWSTSGCTVDELD